MKEFGEVLKHVYMSIKVNKCDQQYEISHPLPKNSFLTERVMCEQYQGFSKAYNLREYFRLRGESSWKSGRQLTGLWATGRNEVYFGDEYSNDCKSLILFHFENDRERLTIYTYPKGYYPSRVKIIELSNAL